MLLLKLLELSPWANPAVMLKIMKLMVVIAKTAAIWAVRLIPNKFSAVITNTAATAAGQPL
jgi:hypothetical protein